MSRSNLRHPDQTLAVPPNMHDHAITAPNTERLACMTRLAVALFLTYLAVAMPLAVIPSFVTKWPGFNAALAGLCVGFSFLSTLLTRGLAGRFCDHRGGDQSMRLGFLCYALGCLLCAASGIEALHVYARFIALLTGRLIIGLGESFTMVGIHVWGIGLIGQNKAGRVLSLTGMAMYGAYAIGGPLGFWLYAICGFTHLMIVCACLPGIGFLLSIGVPRVSPAPGMRRAFLTMVRLIKWHGISLFLQGIGFSVIGAYLAVAFNHHHWSYGSLGLTCFGIAFVGVRFFIGGFADKYGGLPVALASLAIEALGLFCVSQAVSPAYALFGAFLTGAGCAMVYPALGRDVVRIVPPENRATALGGFAAFQDIAYACTAPLAGRLADLKGYPTVFFCAALCAAVGVMIVICLIYASTKYRHDAQNNAVAP